MDKEKALESLNSLRYKYSEEAQNVIENVYTNYDEKIPLEDRIFEEVGEYFIYYSDAFNYLRDNHIYDFEDAISEGFGKNVCSIASYYLEQEVFDLLNELDD